MSMPPAQPPGWYHAQGDPPGSHRWWDGTQWVGGPVAVAPTAYGGHPAHGVPGYGVPGFGSTRPVQYSGWWRRFGAYLIDGLIVGVPGGVINAIAQSAAPEKTVVCTDFRGRAALCEQPTAGGWLLISFVGLVLFVAGVAYYAYFNGTKGQTLGKQACGIKVLDRNTLAPIGIGRAVGRYFGSIVSAIPCLLGFLWAAWDQDKQTWHDKMVNSVVVMENR